MAKDKKANRYSSLILNIFQRHYKKGAREVDFERSELESTAKKLRIKLPKNLGDVIYSVRYRTALPKEILATQEKGMEWIIEGSGRSKYKFRLVKINRIVPNKNFVTIKVPNATPEIITSYALSDEQALLAKVRYNRLVDVFLGVASHSLQSHLRTNVRTVGQIEIDEIYVGVDRHGRHYIIPVQAKGGRDQHSVVQTRQDVAYCKIKYPNLICRAISAQFIENDLIAMFELVLEDDEVRVVEEKHYKLVPASDITEQDLKDYSIRG